MRLFYRGEQREFKALADSGNRLREPVSGRPVSVVYVGDLKGFCDSVDGVVYIPYRAVGTRAGLLPAVIFEKMEIVWEKGRWRSRDRWWRWPESRCRGTAVLPC